MGALLGMAEAGGSGPVVIVSRGRRQLADTVSIEWSKTIAVEADARQVQTRVAIRMAQHFRDSLLAGVRHDTGAALPRDRDGTPVAVQTGWMAKHWKIGPALGSARAATVALDVNIADRGRAIASRRWPLLQSAQGRAYEVMQRAFAEEVARMFREPRTKKVPTSGGTVDVLERAL